MRSSSWRFGLPLCGLMIAVLGFARQTSAQPEDVLPPSVVAVSPADGWHIGADPLQVVRIDFSEPVKVPEGSVLAWTQRSGVYRDIVPVLSSDGRTLMIGLARAIRDDRLLIHLHHSITDLAGNPLDGETESPDEITLPSGDGLPGGPFVARFHVLKGDATRDGKVTSDDLAFIGARLGTSIEDDDFDDRADVDGDGRITAADVLAARQHLGRTLTRLDTQPNAAVRSPTPIGLTFSDLAAVELQFSERLRSGTMDPRSVYLMDRAGTIYEPIAVTLLNNQRAARLVFDPPLPQCEAYEVRISPSVQGPLGGVLDVTNEPPPAISGLAPPPPPAVETFDAVVRSDRITLRGTVLGSSEIVVQGGASIAGPFTPDPNGRFEVDVPLQPNRLNPLFVTAVSPCGQSSAPVSARVISDLQPPTLHIDFPPDGAEIVSSRTDVAGRVSDMLSGFAGLSVRVNGRAAEVNIGIGTNGTFFLPGLVLDASSLTPIEVIATDSVGNTITKSISVRRLAPDPDAARMTIASGNNQNGRVHTALARPITVELKYPNGGALANKIVTFDVARSDGLLGTSPTLGDGARSLQVRTDASGRASAYWRLGGDAGCGNNRVHVTSRDVQGTIMFCASAAPGPASQINIGSGNNQRAEAGTLLPEPLRVYVNDGCNGIGNVPVTFSVVSGGGLVNGVSSATVRTGPTGHAEVRFALGPERGNHTVEATFPSYSGSPATFNAVGVVRDPLAPTRFTGVVLDNSMQPVGGAHIELVIAGQTFISVSEIDGVFRYDDLPMGGPAELHVDALTANMLGGAPIPIGSFPALHYEIVVVPNAENALPMPVLVPRLNPANARLYSTTADTELTVEGIEGLRMVVKAGSMRLPNGQPAPDGTVMALNQVHHDDVPMPMPDGAAPPFAWTLQPAGAIFDPPIFIEYPNMSALPPGSIAYFLSFDHDTGRFEIVSSGHVSEDGASIFTDPGSGLTLAGWGCNCPPYSIAGSCCSIPSGERGEDRLQMSITVGQLEPEEYVDFLVGPNERGIPVEIDVCPDSSDVSVRWRITPIGTHSGTVTPDSGSSKQFTFKPKVTAAQRPVAGSRTANAAVGYTIVAAATWNDQTVTKTAVIRQDDISRLRQEYVDFRAFGSPKKMTLSVPARAAVGPPIATTNFTGAEFNRGNYDVVVNGGMQSHAQMTRTAYGSPITLTSAYRNPRRNKEVGGAANSVHMTGGAVDMVPATVTRANKVSLYRAALGSGASLVLLEKGAKQLLPGNWSPPPASHAFIVPRIGAPDWVIMVEDSTSDGLPDRVAMVSDLNIPSSLMLLWDGNGTTNPLFRIGDTNRNGVINPNEPLQIIYQGKTRPLSAVFDESSHTHAQGDAPTPAPLQPRLGTPLRVDEFWTVSVGGQAATPRASGAVSIRNIPSPDLFGLSGPGSAPDFLSDEFLRLMGSSVIDGRTWYAFSEVFQLQQGETFPISDLTITDVPPPLTSSLHLEPLDGSKLLEVGETLQLKATALLGDETELDVTQRSRWTVYRTSNPAIATVGPNGLVTAHRPGRVVITAVNEGAASVVRLVVTEGIVTTTVEGIAISETGRRAAGAIITIGPFGSAIADASGFFRLADIELPGEFEAVSVSGSWEFGGDQYGGSAGFVPVVRNGLTDAGIIRLTKQDFAMRFAGALSNSELADLVDNVSQPTLPSAGSFVPAGNGIVLATDYLRVGLNAQGTFNALGVGFRADPLGNRSYGADVVTPGTQRDVWAARFSSAGQSFWATGGSDDSPNDGNVTVDSFQSFSTGGVTGARSITLFGPLRVETTTSLPNNAPVAFIDVQFTNTGGAPIENLRYARSVDLDANGVFNNIFDVFESPRGATLIAAWNTGQQHVALATSAPFSAADGVSFAGNNPDAFSNRDPNGAFNDYSATFVFRFNRIEPGQTVRLRDAIVTREGFGSVEGVVADDEGPVANALVQIVCASAPSGVTTRADASGKFRFGLVPTGERLTVSILGRSGETISASGVLEGPGDRFVFDLAPEMSAQRPRGERPQR